MLTPNKTHSHALVDILYLSVDFMVVYLRENGFCQEVPLFSSAVITNWKQLNLINSSLAAKRDYFLIRVALHFIFF